MLQSKKTLGLLLFASSLTALAGPLVIAHRGNSAEFPEHSLASYLSAVQMGVDFIEQDIVADRDGELWIRHERNIVATTNAKELFKEKIHNGQLFIDQLHTHEVKKLKLRQRFSFRSQRLNDRESMLSLKDLVRWILSQPSNRVGLYIETKDSEYYRNKNFSLERKIAEVLRPLIKAGRNPVIFQSESLESLKEFSRLLPQFKRTLLLTKKKTIKWEEIRNIVDVLGLQKEMIVPFNPVLRIAGRPTDLVNEAHRRGLEVHAWTLRDEWWFRPFFKNGAKGEYQQLEQLGVDGVFTDFPQTALCSFQ